MSRIGEVAGELGGSSVLLVTGKQAMRRQGYREKLLGELRNWQVIHFEEVEPNPSLETVERGLELCREGNCHLVIGLGGGSSLDVAKAVAVLKNNPGKVEEYLRGEREFINSGIPVIAIPSTSGSGSEVTPFSILTVPKERLKFSLRNPILYPRAAIVDPVLTVSLPARQTAATGLDALSHALESIWSVQNQPLASLAAERAIELIFRYLVAAYRNGNDQAAREGMSQASMLAGLAISQTGTTAIHPASYPLTFDFGLEHGLACSLFILPFLKYNKNHIQDRLQRLNGVLGLRKIEDLETKIKALVQDLQVPVRLREIGIAEEMIPELARRGIGKSTNLNPGQVEEKDLEGIIREIF